MRHKPRRWDVSQKGEERRNHIVTLWAHSGGVDDFYRIIEIIVLYQSKMTNKIRVLSG